MFGAPPKEDPNGEFIGSRRKSDAGSDIAERLSQSGVLGFLDKNNQRAVEDALRAIEAARKDHVMLLGPSIRVRLD